MGAPGTVSQGPSSAPVTGAEDPRAFDLAAWQRWWRFNQAPYLDLKEAIHARGPRTGSELEGSLRPDERVIRDTVVPALRAALETDRQSDVVASCLVALAKIGDSADPSAESFEPLIRRFLKDPNQEVAETAAVSLGILASDASVLTLTHLMADDAEGRALVRATEVSYRTRAFAAYGLGLVGHRTARPDVRMWIAMKLAEVLKLPEMPTPDLQAAAVIALGLVEIDARAGRPPPALAGATHYASSREDQLRFLLAYFEDESHPYRVRALAPRSMERLLPADASELRAEVVESLLAAAGPHSDEPNEVQRSAILALGRIADADSDPLDQRIRALLAERIGAGGDELAKRFAAIALAQAGGRPGKDDAGYAAVRKSLATGLARGGMGMSRLRPWLGLALGVLQRARIERGAPPDREIAQVVREALLDCKAPADLGAYCVAAGLGRDPESVEILLAKLGATADDEARGSVAVGLGLLGAFEAGEAIEAIVRESRFRPDLLREASIGLALLGEKQIVPDLVAMLAQAKSLSSQAAIASALGAIGDARSIDPLVAMLADQEITASARAFAAVALGIVADKELLPWNAKIATDIDYAASMPTLTDPSGRGILDIL